jgi:hypothetical protein
MLDQHHRWSVDDRITHTISKTKAISEEAEGRCHQWRSARERGDSGRELHFDSESLVIVNDWM